MARIELTRRHHAATTIDTTVTPIVQRPTGHLTFVFAAVLASRVPFLLTSPGAGPDVDASRLVLAGRALAATGHYHLSRNPGYPLVELVAAALASTPVAVLVGLTAVVGAIGAAAFADLLRTLEVRAWIPLTVAYAATPLVWLSDLTFMDYGWAQGAAMVALALLARRRFAGCGVVLGLALACRPAAVVVVAVVVVVLVAHRERRGAWLRVGGPLVALAAACQLLPLLSLGPLYLRFVDQSVPWWVAAGRMSTGVWGWAGTAAIGAGAVVAVAARRRADPWPPEHRAWELACLAGVAATVAMFLRLPVDSGYLLPAVPLVLVLLGSVLPVRAVAVLAGALLLSSLYAPGPKALGLSVPEATAGRRTEDARLAALVTTARRLPPGAVLPVGKDLPRLLVLLPEAAGQGLEYDLGWNPVPARAVLPGGGVLVA